MLYVFEEPEYKKLIEINKRLYDGSKPFTSDDKRDMANLLDIILHDKVIIINEGEK